MKRDKNVRINWDDHKTNKDWYWLRELTKVKHITQVITFSDKKVSEMKIVDYGLNCILITTHILKPGGVHNEGDIFAGQASDMTMKELAGVFEHNTKAVSLDGFSLKSDMVQTAFSETKNPDPSKYDKVMHMFEQSEQPFTYKFDYDVFVGKGHEPLTVMQAHNEDGTEFEVTTAYLGLASKGNHDYYGWNTEMKEKDLETFTNVITYAGVPSMVKGPYLSLTGAGWATRKSDGHKVRLGLMFQDGLAKHEGIANSNANAFTIDGKLFKLGTMRIGEGFNPNAQFIF